MHESAEQHASAAIFAADGSARQRLVRAGVAAGIALVAAWLIALALGVLGGFDALPGLPSSHPRESSQASEQTRHAISPAPRVAHPAGRARAPRSVASTGAPSHTHATAPASKPAVSSPNVQAPSTSSVSTSSGQGQARTPTTTGKPVGSPGNGPGGSGAPGQLR